MRLMVLKYLYLYLYNIQDDKDYFTKIDLISFFIFSINLNI